MAEAALSNVCFAYILRGRSIESRLNIAGTIETFSEMEYQKQERETKNADSQDWYSKSEDSQ